MEKKTVNITYGHNKDRRPDCKQAVLGQISNESGIVLHSRVMNGNTSDVTWNKEALKFVQDIQNEHTTANAIYVADCKLMTKKLFLSMTKDKILFLSRVPANFAQKLEERIRKEAYEEDNWEDIGKISDSKKACNYEIQQFTKEVYGKTIRLIVVKSSASLSSFKASLEKRKKQIDDAMKAFNKKVFACKTDALRDWEDFKKKYNQEPYVFSM